MLQWCGIHTYGTDWIWMFFIQTLCCVLLVQCGINASGLQRAGDWQEDGREKVAEPGGEEEGAGWEAWHGLRNQEVTLYPLSSVTHSTFCKFFLFFIF